MAYDDHGDYDVAATDHAKALEIEPRNFEFARSLGLSRFYHGDFLRAAADLLVALKLRDNSHATLLRYLARKRLGEAADSELEENAVRMPTEVWSYAIVELYLGRRSLPEYLNATPRRTNRCHDQFYVGEWHLSGNNTAAALASLSEAAQGCPKDSVEYRAAGAELKRLKPQAEARRNPSPKPRDTRGGPRIQPMEGAAFSDGNPPRQ
jgi:lipoprotein NlpI